MIQKYICKKNEVEAIQFTYLTASECYSFLGKYAKSKTNREFIDVRCGIEEIRAMEGDYIIKLSEDHYYVCDPQLFEEIYRKEINGEINN